MLVFGKKVCGGYVCKERGVYILCLQGGWRRVVLEVERGRGRARESLGVGALHPAISLLNPRGQGRVHRNTYRIET